MQKDVKLKEKTVKDKRVKFFGIMNALNKTEKCL